ncbi:MAG: DUF3147 family protein [Terriglobia bacterium]
MKIGINAKALRETTWKEYAIRFLVGGAITTAAGLIAKKFGPGAGGLFLAYPAILPASATLIEKHKADEGNDALKAIKKGRNAASLDAAGAAIGSAGLAVFALLAWVFLPAYRDSLVLAASTVAWLLISLLIWWTLKRRPPFLRL